MMIILCSSGGQWKLLQRWGLCAEIIGRDRRHRPQIPETQSGGHASAQSEGTSRHHVMWFPHAVPGGSLRQLVRAGSRGCVWQAHIDLCDFMLGSWCFCAPSTARLQKHFLSECRQKSIRFIFKDWNYSQPIRTFDFDWIILCCRLDSVVWGYRPVKHAEAVGAGGHRDAVRDCCGHAEKTHQHHRSERWDIETCCTINWCLFVHMSWCVRNALVNVCL